MNVKQIATHTARALRKNQTLAEKKFWSLVRDKRIKGLKFLRQYPIYFKWEDKTRFFIADFYCDALKLVVEIDGGIHEQQKEYDLLRENILLLKKITVARFSNEDVLQNSGDVKIQLENIFRTIQKNPPLNPLP